MTHCLMNKAPSVLWLPLYNLNKIYRIQIITWIPNSGDHARWWGCSVRTNAALVTCSSAASNTKGHSGHAFCTLLSSRVFASLCSFSLLTNNKYLEQIKSTIAKGEYIPKDWTERYEMNFWEVNQEAEFSG